jgi:hypothetical protein
MFAAIRRALLFIACSWPPLVEWDGNSPKGLSFLRQTCGTPGRASHLRTKPGCFRSFSRPTMPSPRRRAALGWDSLYPSASLRCTGAGSGSSHRSAKARRFLSHSQLSSSSKSMWNRNRLTRMTQLYGPAVCCKSDVSDGGDWSCASVSGP